MLAFLGEGGVIHDPGRHRPVPRHRRQHPVAGHAQNRRSLPGRAGDEVMHRLVSGGDMAGIDPGRHRLNTLPVPRQAQPGEVGAQRLAAIRVAEGVRHPLDVLPKAPFMGTTDVGHAPKLA